MENNVDKKDYKSGSYEDELVEFVENIETWLMVTEDARFMSERNRDYKDHKQWTESERAEIEKRWQAAVTVNRIHPKVEGLKGLVSQRKTDPKAYSRTPKHEKAAYAVSDALRYVADNNRFDKLKISVADNLFVEGYGAAITQILDRGKGPEITVTQIPWDRYYFDPNSRELDFSDKRWDGIVLWMDEEVVKETFDLSDDEISDLYNSDIGFDTGYETFEDRPRWCDRKEKRIRICQHFYIKDAQWHECYFTHNKMLIEPAPVEDIDEYDEPLNPIEACSAYIDRDNNRFGEVNYWIDLQDEVNHRRSKFLFLLSQRQTMARRGAVQDIAAMKRELAKPNGHVEYDGEKGDFDILPTNDMGEAQITMMNEAKSELDSVGFNATMANRPGDMSNQAIMTLQQSGTNELSSLFENLLDWETRMYRQFWYRIRQYWDDEKWLRVLDDQTNIRWVGLNQKIKLKDFLEEQAKDESLPIPRRDAALNKLQTLMQQQSPQLEQVVEIRNPTPDLDVDIMIETSYDLVNIQREQFDMLFKLAQVRPEVPFTELLKMSELRNKDKIIKSIEAGQEAQDKAAQEQQAKQDQRDQAELQSDIESARAASAKSIEEARKRRVEADQTVLQSEIMLEQGVEDPAVVI